MSSLVARRASRSPLSDLAGVSCSLWVLISPLASSDRTRVSSAVLAVARRRMSALCPRSVSSNMDPVAVETVQFPLGETVKATARGRSICVSADRLPTATSSTSVAGSSTLGGIVATWCKKSRGELSGMAPPDPTTAAMSGAWSASSSRCAALISSVRLTIPSSCSSRAILAFFCRNTASSISISWSTRDPAGGRSTSKGKMTSRAPE
mmetsp:Transcript_94743/g.253414  ORF Transcript_94743/g.253414 Transcript_94743/m.253414 type:complete len:208 (+) Transcript_94743:1086-1709(+)